MSSRQFRPRYSHIATALLLALAPLLAQAENSNKASEKEDTLVVSGSALTLKLNSPAVEAPRSISEVTRDDLDTRAIKNVDEALRYSSGVFATPYGPDNKTDWLFVRGFGWSRYQDGLQTMSEDGFYVWKQETSGIEGIHLLKGPSSMLYGQNPPGGLVNVVTKHPQREQKGKLDVAYGTNDYRHLSVENSGSLDDDGDVQYNVVVTGKKENGPLYGAHNERIYVAPSLLFNLSNETTLTLLATYLRDRGTPTSGFKLPYGTLQDTPFGKVDYKANFGEPGFDKNNIEQFSLGYELEHHFNDVWQLKQNMSYSHMSLELASMYAAGLVDGSDRLINRGLTYRNGSAQSWAIDTRLVGNWQMDISENTLLLGVDYFNAKSYGRDANLFSFGSPIDIFDPQYGQSLVLGDQDTFRHETKRQQTGLYIQNQFKFDDHWLLLVGGRYDFSNSRDLQPESNTRSDMNDKKFTKSAGFMYIADNGLHPYISYSESFQPLAGVDGNGKAYKPLSGQQTEIGLKYQPENYNLYINAALYQLDQKNSLTNDENHPGVQTQKGEARSRGIELEAATKIYDQLSLHASYTFNKVFTKYSGNKAEVGKDLAAMPRHMASLWGDYQFEGLFTGLNVGAGVRYVGSSFGDNLGSANLKVPAFTLVDMMFGYKLNKHWNMQVNVNNLANKKYVSACSYWCYYGDGRTVTAKVSYNW